MKERKVVSDLNSIYLEVIKAGYTPEQIKETVIEEFNQFFINKQVL